jgi:hypothetical protein
VKDRPTDASLRGNYGVMYYRNFYYNDAVEQLSLAIDGGKTDDGLPIKGLPLSEDPRISEYYFTYGLALARTNQCGKALPIAQTLQGKFQSDELIMDAANTIIEVCQENLDNPAVDTPVPTGDATDTTSTPDLNLTATP